MTPDAPTIRDVHSDDAVVYPVTDNVGESGLQNFILRHLLTLLEDYFAFVGRQVLAGGDQFFYYKQGDPRACVAPDVYIIDDETVSQRHVPSWKAWEHAGKVPTLALEIVSSDYRKDYREQILDRYQALGVRELIRYDPEPALRGTRQLLSHYVRDDAGRLAPRPCPPDRVQSTCFDFWLVPQPDQSLHLATGPQGATPWRNASQRAADVAARTVTAANARADAAEAELQRLRAELTRLRGE